MRQGIFYCECFKLKERQKKQPLVSLDTLLAQTPASACVGITSSTSMFLASNSASAPLSLASKINTGEGFSEKHKPRIRTSRT